ncbi:reverse transcriptase domain-containing protein [Mycolicibacterium conceptionense]|nr:reverse transcriptase domain-containing protein [Mycolicibacterium conceptionense]
MKKLSAPLIKRLNLRAAVVAEAATIRNLLPNEPMWDKVAAQAGPIAGFLENQLRAGFQPAPQVEIAARKPAHGVRPVPYWGTLERVAYRALTTAAVADLDPFDRSPQTYINFITEPGRYARDRQPARAQNRLGEFFLFLESPVKYVVKSDITAFYQFIDHAVLANELLLLGVNFELIEALMELLAEVQGRNYGLPQLLDASDMLSEIYADRIERDLLRSGFAAWRFNDDFRIACDTYADSLAAIEALDAAARRVGLVLSEHKTVTVGIVKYILDALGLSPSEAGQAVNLDDVEDIVGDYTDDFGKEDADAAYDVIRKAEVRSADFVVGPEEAHSINLSSIRGEDVRLLRRAINGLTLAGDARAVDEIVQLARYAPSLTPNLMRYLRTIGDQCEPQDDAWDDIIEAVDRLAGEVALNAWQNMWLVDVIHDLGLLSRDLGDEEAAKRRAEWVDDLRRDTENEALRAAATRALAAQGLISLTSVIAAADRTSDALLHFYTSAGRECAQLLTGIEATEAQKALTAWAKSSKLHGFLLGDS